VFPDGVDSYRTRRSRISARAAVTCEIVLPITSTTIRLFLHVLAATVWVGGQVALASVVPVVRRVGGIETARAVARRFQLIAWPAYGVLVVTGVWNLLAVHVGDQSSSYLSTLLVKLLLVGVSGMGALGHILSARRHPAVGGMLAGVGLLAAIAATFAGVLLAAG
jgi:putative copper export protein